MSDRHSTEYLQAMAILRDWRAEKVHRKRIQEQTQWWYLTLHDLFLEIERLREGMNRNERILEALESLEEGKVLGFLAENACPSLEYRSASCPKHMPDCEQCWSNYLEGGGDE
jgi:hypothetical protein